jgi:hypothetical protein
MNNHSLKAVIYIKLFKEKSRRKNNGYRVIAEEKKIAQKNRSTYSRLIP